MLAVLYDACQVEIGKLKLLGGSNHRCSVRSLSEVRFLAIAMPELLHYIGASTHTDDIAHGSSTYLCCVHKEKYSHASHRASTANPRIARRHSCNHVEHSLVS
jgi:hypothetical protein